MSPQFERLEDIEILWVPKIKEEFDMLPILSEDVLHKMGCRKWSDYNETVKENKVSKFLKNEESPTELSEVEKWIMVYPGEWYDNIPEKYNFKRKGSDDDIRYGCLAYGFLKNK